jgi:hypothetical protein
MLTTLQAESSEPAYALHRDGKVVGFALNRWQNSRAPAEIWVGPGPAREHYAEIFIRDQPIVPVLIRDTEHERQWQCAGHFRLRHHTDENSEKNKRVKPFDVPAIYKILFLEEVR